MKRVTAGFSIAMIAASMMFTLIAAFSVAEVRASETLTIKVGYYGTEYVTQAVFSAGEIEAMGASEYLYTCLDSGGYLRYGRAYGTTLETIFANAGIDSDSIDMMHFYCDDGYYVSFGSRILSGGSAYPAMSQYYGVAAGVTDYDAVYASETGVPAILAILDNFERVTDFSEYNPDDHEMWDGNCLRLYFGQSAGPDSVNANNMASGISEIDVQLLGSPPEPPTEPETTTAEPEPTEPETTTAEPEPTTEPVTEPEPTEPETTVEPEPTEPETTVEPTTEPKTTTAEPTTEPTTAAKPTEPVTEPETTVPATTEEETLIGGNTEPADVPVETTADSDEATDDDTGSGSGDGSEGRKMTDSEVAKMLAAMKRLKVEDGNSLTVGEEKDNVTALVLDEEENPMAPWAIGLSAALFVGGAAGMYIYYKSQIH